MAVTESSSAREQATTEQDTDSGVEVAKERAQQVARRPGVAHLMRANERFGIRLGSQFGAAITYFSVLSMVPIIMFAFAITGFVLVVAAPQLMDQVLAAAGDALAGMGEEQRQQILAVIENSLRDWQAVGIVGLLSAMYSGAGWAGNLKEAVRAMWRRDFDLRVQKENIVVKTLKNFAILIGLLIMMAISFAVASVSTTLTDQIIGLLGLDDVGWLSPVLRIAPVLISIGAGWLIFMYIYTVMPETRVSWRTVRRGALIGAVGLAVLQYLTTFLMGVFAGNPAAALFGPVISLMLFFNLFARLTLFVAAWIGTADAPVTAAHSRRRRRAGQQTDAVAPDPVATDPAVPAEGEPAVTGPSAGDRPSADPGEPDETGAPAAEVDELDHRGDWSSTPGLVTETAAVRSVRAGMGAGYLTGVATGAGIGALIARLLSRFVRRG